MPKWPECFEDAKAKAGIKYEDLAMKQEAETDTKQDKAGKDGKLQNTNYKGLTYSKNIRENLQTA